MPKQIKTSYYQRPNKYIHHHHHLTINTTILSTHYYQKITNTHTDKNIIVNTLLQLLYYQPLRITTKKLSTPKQIKTLSSTRYYKTTKLQNK